jgi:WD40 repeat protein
MRRFFSPRSLLFVVERSFFVLVFVIQEDVDENPYHKLHLEGHEHAVRALAARGRTLVSGSYDCMVRIWDIITGQCKWVLAGHTQKGAPRSLNFWMCA